MINKTKGKNGSFSYAKPLNPNFDKCTFYHSMDIPGHGEVVGEWDLRPNIDIYLGNTDFGGKRVLEIGPASGFLTQHMDKSGADVVSVDVPISQGWDFVPRPAERDKILAERRTLMERLQNSFWFLHKAAKLKSKVVYHRVTDIDDSIGIFDVSVVASILLHSRDPIGIICKCAELTSNRIVITELLLNAEEQLKAENRYIKLVPSVQNNVNDVWYQISPQLIIDLLMLLGFKKIGFQTHNQYYVTMGKQCLHYTIVAEKTD